MGLHLFAEDAEDLPPLSALVQDAAVRVADIHYDAPSRRFVMLMARYGWETASPQRSRSALRFSHVLKVQQRGLARARPGDVLDLLSLRAEACDSSVDIRIDFSGGAALRLTCDSVDAVLEDFGNPWPAVRTPKH